MLSSCLGAEGELSEIESDGSQNPESLSLQLLSHTASSSSEALDGDKPPEDGLVRSGSLKPSTPRASADPATPLLSTSPAASDDELKEELDALFVYEPQRHAQKMQRVETLARLIAGMGGVAPPQLLCGVFMYRCGDFYSVPPPDSMGSDATVAFITTSLTLSYVPLSMELMSTLINSCRRDNFPNLLYTQNSYHNLIKLTAGGVKITRSLFWLAKAWGIETNFSFFFWGTAPFFLIVDAAMNYHRTSRGIDSFFNRFVYSAGEEVDQKRAELVARAESKARTSAINLPENEEKFQTARLFEEKERDVSQGLARYYINTAGRVLTVPGYLLIWQWIFTSDSMPIPVGVNWPLASAATLFSFAGNGEWLFDPSTTTTLPCCVSCIYSITQPVAFLSAVVTAGVWGSLNIYMIQATYDAYPRSWADPLLLATLGTVPFIEFSKALTIFYEATNDCLKRVTYYCQPPEIQKQSKLSRILKDMLSKSLFRK